MDITTATLKAPREASNGRWGARLTSDRRLHEFAVVARQRPPAERHQIQPFVLLEPRPSKGGVIEVEAIDVDARARTAWWHVIPQVDIVPRKAEAARRRLRAPSTCPGTVAVGTRYAVPDELPSPIEGQALIYATAVGMVHVEVLYGAETFWLTINRMAELFGTTKQTIS